MTSAAIHVAQVPESGWPCPLPPPLGCNLSTNRKRKPKWRRCVAASIAVGPAAILTGSRTRPSDWGSNARLGLVEDRRNNRRLATFTCTLCVLQLSVFSRFGGCHLSPFHPACVLQLSVLLIVKSCTLCTILQPILWQGVRVATVGEQTHSIVIAHIPSRSRCGWSSLVAAPGPHWVLQIWRLSPFTLPEVKPPTKVQARLQHSRRQGKCALILYWTVLFGDAWTHTLVYSGVLLHERLVGYRRQEEGWQSSHLY